MRQKIQNKLQLVNLAMLIGAALSSPADAQKAPTPSQITERTIERRAIEAVNWGMPVVNFDRMVQAMLGAKDAFNQIVYWSGFSDRKNQTLTPNPDTIYFKPFIDTKNVGPMVLEIPPASDAGSITGTIMDSWQAALEDVGPAGVDKGKGGKYLILPPASCLLPPGYKDTPPELVLMRWRHDEFLAFRFPDEESERKFHVAQIDIAAAPLLSIDMVTSIECPCENSFAYFQVVLWKQSQSGT